MSRNDWEEGTLILPAKEFKKVFDAIKDAANKQLQTTYECLTAAHAVVVRDFKGKRNVGAADLTCALDDEVSRQYRARHRHADDDEVYDAASGSWGAIRKMVYVDDQNPEKGFRRIPNKPLKSQFKPCTSNTPSFHCAEAAVVFNREKRTVRWCSGEGNHQVERVRGGWLGRTLFSALGRVAWTRGSGGVFIGNDEYNRDNLDYGGASNYVTAPYGPLGEKEVFGDVRSRGSRRASRFPFNPL